MLNVYLGNIVQTLRENLRKRLNRYICHDSSDKVSEKIEYTQKIYAKKWEKKKKDV